jgi:hypothetical protein
MGYLNNFWNSILIGPQGGTLLFHTIIFFWSLFVLSIKIFAIDEFEHLGTAEGKEN